MEEIYTVILAKAPQSDIDAIREFIQSLEEKLDDWGIADEDFRVWLQTAALAFGADTDIGVYRSSTNVWHLVAGGVIVQRKCL